MWLVEILLASHCKFFKYSRIINAAAASSPAALAACLVEPARTLPAAKTPGIAVISVGLVTIKTHAVALDFSGQEPDVRGKTDEDKHAVGVPDPARAAEQAEMMAMIQMHGCGSRNGGRAKVWRLKKFWRFLKWGKKNAGRGV